MAPASDNEAAHLPIARQFTINKHNVASERVLDPSDSISVRKVESMSLIFSSITPRQTLLCVVKSIWDFIWLL